MNLQQLAASYIEHETNREVSFMPNPYELALLKLLASQKYLTEDEYSLAYIEPSTSGIGMVGVCYSDQGLPPVYGLGYLEICPKTGKVTKF